MRFVLEHPCGLRIERTLRESLVQEVDGVTPSDMGTGHVWYRLPQAEIAGRPIAMSLCFYEQRLDSLSFADVHPEYGISWEDWSEAKEKARADATERWLEALGYAVGDYDWGVVWAGTDPKTGGGGGGVRFERTSEKSKSR